MNENVQPMAHEEAEQHNLVESYLLNELTEEQRERFEEHYFDCTICAEAVMAGQVFVRGIRPPDSWWQRLASRLRAPMPVPAWRMWAMAGSVAASLTLVAVQLHYAGAPLAMANLTILAKEEKSALDDNVYKLNTPSVTVDLNAYGTDPFPLYRITISRDRREIISQTAPAPAKQANHRLSLQLPAKALGSGSFTVTLFGLESADDRNAKALGTYYFSTVAAQ